MFHFVSYFKVAVFKEVCPGGSLLNVLGGRVLSCITEQSFDNHLLCNLGKLLGFSVVSASSSVKQGTIKDLFLRHP